jgi:hypothetical protein
VIDVYIPDDSYEYARRLGLHLVPGPVDHPADDPDNLCDRWTESNNLARRCVLAPPHDTHNARTGVRWAVIDPEEEI